MLEMPCLGKDVCINMGSMFGNNNPKNSQNFILYCRYCLEKGNLFLHGVRNLNQTLYASCLTFTQRNILFSCIRGTNKKSKAFGAMIRLAYISIYSCSNDWQMFNKDILEISRT